MKIFYFTNTRLPSQHPQSVHVMKMAQSFARAGHDVTLFANCVGIVTPEDIFKVYDTTPCFELKLSTHLPIPLFARLKMMRDISSTVSRDSRPDLIYGHDTVALAKFARNDVPIIYEAHALPNDSADHAAFLKLLYHPLFKAIVTVSDVLKQEFLRKYDSLDAREIFVAHDGADLIENLSSRAVQDVKLKGSDNSYVVGYAGSLHPGKGLALIQRLAKIRPDYGFHILGGNIKHVQKLESENRLKNLYFYGHRDHADVPAYLRAFDVCLAPYQHRALIKTGKNTSRWISPMKIFEYMAVKKPIIASNLPVIQEILDDEHSALLVSAAYEEKWAEALDLLNENRDIAEKLADNAHDSLRDKYTWDKRAVAIMDYCMEQKSSVHFRTKKTA